MKYDDAYDFEAKILGLPQGKDPDEVIRDDASQWQKLITDAKPMINFILDTVIAKVDLENPKDKSTAVDKLLPLLSQIKDPIRRGHYVQKLAQLLKIADSYVEDRLRQFQAAERRRRVSKGFRRPTLAVPALVSSSPLEEYCLALLLQYPDLKSEGMGLSPDYFEQSENRELFLRWLQYDEFPSLEDSLDSSLYEYLGSLLAKDFLPTLRESEVARQQTLNDCIVRLQERWLRSLEAKKEELLAMEAEVGGVTAQLTKLEEQGIEESKQLREVFVKQGHRRQPIARRTVQ